MKNISILMILLLALNGSAYACKLTSVGASALKVTAAVNEYASISASAGGGNVRITSLKVISDGFIDIRARDGSQVLRTVYKVTINPDCSTIIANVKPSE